MTFFNLIFLAMVQGITEFLPISSSAHLVLLHEAGGPTPDDLLLDVAVHLGSLVAVVLYFRSDVRDTIRGGINLVWGRATAPDSRLALGLAVSTLPAVAVGADFQTGDAMFAVRKVVLCGHWHGAGDHDKVWR